METASSAFYKNVQQKRPEKKKAIIKGKKEVFGLPEACGIDFSVTAQIPLHLKDVWC